MPSTLRAVATVAGCAALSAATLVVTAGPSSAVPQPTISSFNPTHAVVGTTVDITGANFNSSQTAAVAFGTSTPTVASSVTSTQIVVKVPTGAKTGQLVVSQPAGAPTTTSAPSSGTFTVDPTPVPAKHTKLALVVSKSSVTYPGKVGVTATLTASGHAVKGLAVGLEHQTRGSSTWHHVSGAATEHTSHTGSAHWTVAPNARGIYRAIFVGTKAYAASTSNARSVGVHPQLSLHLPSSSDALLKITATGKLTPHLSGVVKLEQRIDHHWHVVATPRVHHGTFKTSVATNAPGTEKFRVVRSTDTRHLSGVSSTASTHVVAPTLRLGSSGAVVEALQKRLAKLHYDVGSRNGSYGWDAEHAVTAFEKVQGLSKDGVAGSGVFNALADPKRIHLKHKVKSGIAVEVNLEKQVLLISKNGKIWRILDTSTAGGYLYTGSNGQTERAITPRGHFHVVYKVNALVHARLGTLYRPSFFNYDGYAIHGEGNGDTGSNVPPYPNSHGCVRITDDAADRYYNLLSVGTSVWIY
jgi:peptidoglycan hydrolase-like protein with peptidoglycan-binding domain